MADDRTQYPRRVRELHQMPKAALASHYRTNCGYIGGKHPPETWTKDELISSILQTEFPDRQA